jgi:type III secretory pathway component EscR
MNCASVFFVLTLFVVSNQLIAINYQSQKSSAKETAACKSAREKNFTMLMKNLDILETAEKAWLKNQVRKKEQRRKQKAIKRQELIAFISCVTSTAISSKRA